MEIPPNILKELEEKKIKALLEEKEKEASLTTVAAPAPSRVERPERQELVSPIPAGNPMGPIGPMTAPLLLEAEPLPPQDQDPERQAPKPSPAELFFSHLSKIAVFLAVFLTPLFFFNSSDVLNLPKQLLLSVLALTVLGAWIGETVSAGKIVWRNNVLAWPAVLIVAAGLLSSIFSSSFWVSFLGDSGRYDFSWISIFSYFIIFLAAVQMFSKNDFDVAVALWLGSVFLVSLYSLLQFFGIHLLTGNIFKSRTFNSIGSPFSLGIFVLSSVPFILAFLQSRASLKYKVAVALAGAVQIFTAALVDFRIGWLALAVSVLVLILVGFKKSPIKSVSPMVPIGLPLAAIVLAVLLWFVPAPQIKDLVFSAEVNPSYRASLGILAGSLKKNPVFGSGLETYPYVYAKFKSVALNQTNYWGVNFSDSASDVLTWVTTTGIFGTLAWLIFVVVFLRYAWRHMGPIRSIGLMANASVGLLASWAFILVAKFFYPIPLALEFFFWFLPALFLLAQEERTPQPDSGQVSPVGPIRPRWSYYFQTGSVKTLAIFFSLLVVLIGALAGGYFSVQRWRAEITFVRAANLSASIAAPVPEGQSPDQNIGGKRDEALNGIYAAIATNPYETRYFMGLAQVLFQKMNDVVALINARPAEERRAKPEETALIQNLTARTINAAQRAVVLDPQSVAVAVNVAESYRNLAPLVQGADDLAIQNYERAADLEPINPFIKTQLGQFYLIKSNLFNYGLEVNTEFADKARGVLDETLRINPNYANARYFRALIQDTDGKKPEALQNFLILRQANPDNQLIAQIITNLDQGLPALGVPPKPAVPPQSPKAKETKGVPK